MAACDALHRKEPRDLVRAREAEEKRVSEELRKVSTILRTSSDRLSRLAEKHRDKVEGLDGLPSLQDKVRSILNFRVHVDETKINGNAHLVLILNTKDEIKAKSDISSIFSGLPTYKNMHVNMTRNLANVYFCDTTDAEKFLGKVYPSIRQVRKGHAWDTATIKKTERLIISPDAKDIETMKSLQDDIISVESDIYRKIKTPTPPPKQVAMPPPPFSWAKAQIHVHVLKLHQNYWLNQIFWRTSRFWFVIMSHAAVSILTACYQYSNVL